MAIQTHKNILPQFASIRPMNLYKQWNLTDLDFTTKSTLKDYMTAKWISSSYVGSSANDYYNNYYSGSIPNFPGLNVKYARYYANETGSGTEPNDDITDYDGFNDYVLSYNYRLGNGDKFYPTYQSQSGWVNPDGSYARLVYYSLKKLFYAENATYHYLLFGSSSQLSSEAIVIEIPQRYVADTIEPNQFILRDSSDIYKLPYSSGSWNWSLEPRNNTSSYEGIKLIDDGNGNLYDANYDSGTQRGNIFYQLGLVVITDVAYARYFREYLIVSGNIL